MSGSWHDWMPWYTIHIYSRRRKNCGAHKKLSNAVLQELVRSKFLDEQWSPQQISERMKLEGSEYKISYNTIYRGIYDGVFDKPGLSHGARGSIRKLRHRGKSRHTKDYEERRGKIRISNELSQRPIEAENRSRLGDWEADTVAGTPGKACLVTLVDRKSRYLLCSKIPAKKAKETSKAMIEMLKDEPCESITPDRGKEFSSHDNVTEVLEVEFYFPLPHHPWQRGSNENTNGLIREYLPKGKDMTEATEQYIEEFRDKINKRPRKCLGYRTPYEIYHSKMLRLI